MVQKYNAYSGKRLTLKKVGREAAVEYHRKRGSLPPDQTDFLIGWATLGEGLEAGEKDWTDPALERLLGRKPRSIDDMAKEMFESKTNKLDTYDFREAETGSA